MLLKSLSPDLEDGGVSQTFVDSSLVLEESDGSSMVHSDEFDPQQVFTCVISNDVTTVAVGSTMETTFKDFNCHGQVGLEETVYCCPW